MWPIWTDWITPKRLFCASSNRMMFSTESMEVFIDDITKGSSFVFTVDFTFSWITRWSLNPSHNLRIIMSCVQRRLWTIKNASAFMKTENQNQATSCVTKPTNHENNLPAKHCFRQSIAKANWMNYSIVELQSEIRLFIALLIDMSASSYIREMNIFMLSVLMYVTIYCIYYMYASMLHSIGTWLSKAANYFT